MATREVAVWSQPSLPLWRKVGLSLCAPWVDHEIAFDSGALEGLDQAERCIRPLEKPFYSGLGSALSVLAGLAPARSEVQGNSGLV